MPANMPRRVKWRKSQKGRIHGNAARGNSVSFGDFGLQSLAPGRVTSRHIEAGLEQLRHHIEYET